MSMTLLQTVTHFCERTNLPSPATVYGSSDAQVVQIKALLEETGIDMASRVAWEGITFEATVTSIAAEDQGALTAVATNGFKYIKNGTIWDRTSKLPILGPLSSQEWQALKALVTAGPRYRFRIRGGHLLINPIMVAGHTLAFEYVSANWILAANLTTYQTFFGADTDTLLLPDTELLQGLRWRWKREKGLSYDEDFRTYEQMLKDAAGRDGAKPVLRMDDEGWSGPRPGIVVPSGNWNLP
jgi:hypothetical protein